MKKVIFMLPSSQRDVKKKLLSPCLSAVLSLFPSLQELVPSSPGSNTVYDSFRKKVAELYNFCPCVMLSQLVLLYGFFMTYVFTVKYKFKKFCHMNSWKTVVESWLNK